MAHLIKIGNSQGVRIPKSIIEQAHLEGKNLKLKIVKNGLLLSPSIEPRAGWKEAIETLTKVNGKEPLDNEWLDASLSADSEIEW